ncbi:MAG TPA: hypothetical protein PLU85_04435 [Bacteroidia bacterium]|nr:hypothetical protein [Bacteroidia bacterium]MBP7715418.1 hypothetical protein [Bacteroidia bacterium]MBP8668691.1 hypothetical protein [Bacteroidia bacterium]HOZ83122.1 hypothetical protein [Bacteroidia bacterium]HOZ89928.1 hypothetical protein [Bacteroidia bacterium]
MKNILKFSVVFLFLAVYACKDYKPEVDRLNRERDSLINTSFLKDSTIDSFLGDFNGIEASLDSINQIHAAITLDRKRDPEMGGTVKDRIRKNMESIASLLDQNSQRIAELTRKLKSSGVKSAQLNKMITSLNLKIAERDSMIANLNNQLGDAKIEITGLRTNIETLNSTIGEREKTIEEKVNQINTAYYAIGTYKQLRDKKILNKKGGFIGIGKTKTINPDIDNSAFTKVDIRQFASVELNTKSVKIMSSHPASAYTYEKDKKKYQSLKITNPDLFWSNSKYLVIVTK